MIPSFAFLVWAYVVARLIQVPIEYVGDEHARKDLQRVSAIFGILATLGLIGVWGASIPSP